MELSFSKTYWVLLYVGCGKDYRVSFQKQVKVNQGGGSRRVRGEAKPRAFSLPLSAVVLYHYALCLSRSVKQTKPNRSDASLHPFLLPLVLFCLLFSFFIAL